MGEATRAENSLARGDRDWRSAVRRKIHKAFTLGGTNEDEYDLILDYLASCATRALERRDGVPSLASQVLTRLGIVDALGGVARDGATDARQRLAAGRALVCAFQLEARFGEGGPEEFGGPVVGASWITRNALEALLALEDLPTKLREVAEQTRAHMFPAVSQTAFLAALAGWTSDPVASAAEPHAPAPDSKPKAKRDLTGKAARLFTALTNIELHGESDGALGRAAKLTRGSVPHVLRHLLGGEAGPVAQRLAEDHQAARARRLGLQARGTRDSRSLATRRRSPDGDTLTELGRYSRR